MYESALFSKTQFKNIINKILEDDIEIEALIGNNGKIQDKEFETLQ